MHWTPAIMNEATEVRSNWKEEQAWSCESEWYEVIALGSATSFFLIRFFWRSKKNE